MGSRRWKALVAVGALVATAWCLPAGAAAPAGRALSAIALGGTLPGSPEVIVTGTGLGASAPRPVRAGNACDPAAPGAFYGTALNFHDLTAGWSAGTYVTDSLGSYNGIVIDSWSESQVRFHFDGCWTMHQSRLTAGDAMTVTVDGIAVNRIVPDPNANRRSGIGAPGASFHTTFPHAPAGGWSSTRIDVKVLRAPLSDPGAFYYYAEQWRLAAPDTPDGQVIAYMGIQTQGFNDGVNVGPMALVSVFTSDPLFIAAGTGTDGRAAWCKTSTDLGEGPISTCRVRFAWQQGHTYRYQFARTAPHQWTATITDVSASGRPVTTLGTFTVPSDWGGIHRVDAGFLEQYIPPTETGPAAAHPVCPSLPQHRTTAQFLHARVDNTVAPISEQPGLHALNDVGTKLVCQNAAAGLVADGVQLDMDLRAPSPPVGPRAVRAGRSVTVSWSPPPNPATVTRGQLESAMFSTREMHGLIAIARPLPTGYTVTVSPGGQRHPLMPAQHSTRFTQLKHDTTYRFSITADNDGGHSPAAVVSAHVPAGP